MRDNASQFLMLNSVSLIIFETKDQSDYLEHFDLNVEE